MFWDVSSWKDMQSVNSEGYMDKVVPAPAGVSATFLSSLSPVFIEKEATRCMQSKGQGY